MEQDFLFSINASIMIQCLDFQAKKDQDSIKLVVKKFFKIYGDGLELGMFGLL